MTAVGGKDNHVNGSMCRSGAGGACRYRMIKRDGLLGITKFRGELYQVKAFWLQVIESLAQLAHTGGSQLGIILSPGRHFWLSQLGCRVQLVSRG